MSVKFLPDQMLKKIAPAKKIKKLLKGNLTLKKAALSFLDDLDYIDKKDVIDTALKVVDSYQQREARAQAEAGFDAAAGKEIKSSILDDPKLLIQRVQNEIIFQVHDGIKKNYGGQRAIWLPSDAEEPRPEHQLNYGKEYTIGEGIDGIEPGDEYGCRCGIEIITDDNELKLD